MYGIQNNDLQWFQNSSESRQQMVKVNNDMSSKLSLNLSVVHGFVLGPLRFLLFINDLQTCVQKSCITLFSDDSSLCTSGTLGILIIKHQPELHLVSFYAIAN